MYCSSCGEGLPAGARYCAACGARVKEARPARAPVESIAPPVGFPAQSTNGSPPQSRTRQRRAWGPAPRRPEPGAPGKTAVIEDTRPGSRQPPAGPVIDASQRGEPSVAVRSAGTPTLLISPDGGVYRSASGLALTITIISAVSAVAGLLGALWTFQAFASAGPWESGPDPEDLAPALLILAIPSLAYFFDLPLLVAWTRRVTGNLKPFGTELELSTGWAIGAFLLPIVSFWFPVRIWNQAWRATDPGLQPPVGWFYRSLRGRHLHWVVWVLWVFMVLAERAFARSRFDSVDELGQGLVVLGLGFAAAHFLLILLVRGLTARQDTYARIWAGAVPAAWPAPPGG